MTQPAVVDGKELAGPLDLSDEQYRTYTFGPASNRQEYTIYNPKQLYFRKGGTTHRVVDVNGLTHCVPAVGGADACVLIWKVREGASPVVF